MSSGPLVTDWRKNGTIPPGLAQKRHHTFMLEELELGLSPVRSYRVDSDFFEEFRE